MLDIDYKKIRPLLRLLSIPMLVTARSWQFLFQRAKELFRREDGASLCNSTSLPLSLSLSLSLSFHCIFIPTWILLLLILRYILYMLYIEKKKKREEDEAPLRWSVTSSPAGLFISQFSHFFLSVKKWGVTL